MAHNKTVFLGQTLPFFRQHMICQSRQHWMLGVYTRRGECGLEHPHPRADGAGAGAGGGRPRPPAPAPPTRHPGPRLGHQDRILPGFEAIQYSSQPTGRISMLFFLVISKKCFSVYPLINHVEKSRCGIFINVSKMLFSVWKDIANSF